MLLNKFTREFRYNLNLSYPVIVGLLGHTLVQFVDNIMVGQLGTAELAAVSLGNSFFFVAMSIGIGFSTAITPLVAESDGKKDINQGRNIFFNGPFKHQAETSNYLKLGVLVNIDSYDELNLAINYPIQTDFRPSSQGVAVASWHIVPGLPEGLYFSQSEGTIWGVPLELRPEMYYNITAIGVDPLLTDRFMITLGVYTDYDGDGMPDGDELNTDYWMDIDDDNDNWTDSEEIACSNVPGQYNTLDSNDFPPDLDLDGICDKLDDFNDAPIILAYPNINLELSMNMPMFAQSPILEGGGVLTWEISPELPEGLYFNEYSGVSINLARSDNFEGLISGSINGIMYFLDFDVNVESTNSSTRGKSSLSLLLT